MRRFDCYCTTDLASSCMSHGIIDYGVYLPVYVKLLGQFTLLSFYRTPFLITSLILSVLINLARTNVRIYSTLYMRVA